MGDTWQEIWAVMKANKLRTVLTGFSVAWGIFMLIVLLAAGNGMSNATEKNYESLKSNIIMLYPGNTSIPFNGLPKGRFIPFDQSDLEYLRANLKDCTVVPEVFIQGEAQGKGSNYESIQAQGVESNYLLVKSEKMVSGRFINDLDNFQQRKVCVIWKQSAEKLFPDGNYLGQYIQWNNLFFQIVGVFDGEGFQSWMYIPYSIAKEMTEVRGRVDRLTVVFSPNLNKAQCEQLTSTIRTTMAKKKTFSPDDQEAIWIWDRATNYQQQKMIFSAISMFIWIIGLGTLTAGIVGISNIMLVSVKERTKEFGIRKALGATPRSMIVLVLVEALTITLSFGYLGMALGVAVTKIASTILDNVGSKGQFGQQMFVDPSVDFGIVVTATLVLVVAGLVAGYIPAKRAVKLKPIEALMAK